MKVLFVNYTMNIGGIENFLINISKELKNNGNEVDFLCYSNEKFTYEYEIKNMNCNIYKIDNPYKVNFIRHLKELYKIIKSGNYDVVHSNTYTNSGYVMLAAYLAGVKIRVTHSHTSQKPINIFQKLKWFIGKILIQCFSNRKIACSDLAGDSLFLTKKYTILENGVNIDKFKYNTNYRKEIRDKYSFENNDIVIGHIGRFSKVKNHKYIIEMFNKLIKLNKNYRLLLVGDGPELNNIKNIVKDYKLEKYIKFSGSVNDSYKYYNAFDLILFPSLYEGLPLSLVEAQINGLQILASDTISKEINLFDNVVFFSLNKSFDNVIKKIYDINNNRKFNLEYFNTSYYNIKNTYKKLMNIYD